MVQRKSGSSGFVPLQYVEHIDEFTEIDQRESSGEDSGTEEKIPTWASSEKGENQPKDNGLDSKAETYMPNYDDMGMSLYDLASNTAFLDHRLAFNEDKDEEAETKPRNTLVDEVMRPLENSTPINKPVDIKTILSSPAESVRGVPPPRPSEQVDLDRTLLSMKSVQTRPVVVQ